jgi:malonate-semialdehyde dehydrogenase (acetylating)/methylmalonate-semialdehyde dehydrogenase
VLGSGATVGEALVGHDGVDMIAFTGETDTGIRVMKRAADGLRKVALELGGKAPNVVFADANLDKALAGAENAIFTTCGQICTAGSRLIVEESIHDELVERLAASTAGLRVGDGLDASTQLGPLASAAQRDKVLEYVDVGKAEATLVAGGAALEGDPWDAGNFVSPAIFADLPASSSLLRDEIFGPVLTVIRVDTYEEAVHLVNDNPYGNGTAIFTRDGGAARQFQFDANIGMVGINVPIPVPVAYYSFGGWKASLFGDLHMYGPEGIQFYTRAKVVTSRWPDPGTSKIDLGFPRTR